MRSQARAFINGPDDAPTTPAEPFRDAAGAEVRVHDPWVDLATSPDAPPGLSRDLEGVLAGADAVVVFAGHREDRGLMPGKVRRRCGSGCAGCDGVGGEVVVIARRPGTRSPGPVQEPRQTGYSGSIQKALNRSPP